uniref:BTB domain-containing protein n=1 Tax=Syphacia muris TaxID=451379 RepID=A0A0N5AAU2_9BILA
MDDSDFVPTTLKPLSSSQHVSDRNIKAKTNKKVMIESDHLLPHSNDSKCYICNKDLSHLNEIRKSLHINTCLDNQEAKNKLSADKKKWENTLDCPMCGEPLQPGPYRAAHAKRCAKKNNVSAARLLVLMETQSQIAEMKKKTGMMHTKLTPPKLEIRKPAPLKEEPRSTFQEQMKLALALSASLNATNEDSVKTKDDGPVVKPRGKVNRNSYSFYELEPRSCKCAVFEQIQENFLKRFKVKRYRDFNEMIRSRLKRSTLLLGDVSKCIRKLERLERLADDYARYGNVGGDCCIICKNGEVLSTHRFIINARAPKLANLIDEAGCLKLEKYSASGLRCYLKFLAASGVEWTRAEESEILDLAESYGPQELKILIKQDVGNVKDTVLNNCDSCATSSSKTSACIDQMDADIQQEISGRCLQGENNNISQTGEGGNSDILKTDGVLNEQLNNLVCDNDVNMDVKQYESTTNNACSDINNEDKTVILTDDDDDDNNDPKFTNVSALICNEQDLFTSNFQKNDELTSEKEFMKDDIKEFGSGSQSNSAIGELVTAVANEKSIPVDNGAGKKEEVIKDDLSLNSEILCLSSDDEQDFQKCSELTHKNCGEPQATKQDCVTEQSLNEHERSEGFLNFAFQCNSGVDSDDLMLCDDVLEKHIHPRSTPIKSSSNNADMTHEFFIQNNGILLSPIVNDESPSRSVSGPKLVGQLPLPSEKLDEDDFSSKNFEQMHTANNVKKRLKRQMSSKAEEVRKSTPSTHGNLIAKRLEELGSNVKVIKTTDVTPMPLYECMNDKDLKQELAKYGVRPLGKKKAIAILRRIYEQTHPLVMMDTSPISSRNCRTFKLSSPEHSAKQTSDLNEDAEEILADCTLNVSLDEDKIREESAVDLMDDEDVNRGDYEGFFSTGNEESNSNAEALPKDIDGMQRVLLKWLQLSDNEQLYNHLLTLNPVSFDEFYDRLSKSDSVAAAIPKKTLIEILDRLHITFKLPDDGWKRKNQKAKIR